MSTKFWYENMKNHSEDLGVDGKMVLEWILGNDGKAWTGFIWLRIWTCEYDNESSGSIKGGKFTD